MAKIRTHGSAAVPEICCELARDFIRGAVHVEELPHKWVRPWRFLPRQRRALESCLAWYPGIYRQMVACTAGVRLEFETDASEVLVELRVDEEPRATRKVLEAVDGSGAKLAHDGLSYDVDGRHVALPMPEPGELAGNPREEWGPSVTLELADGVDVGGLLQLPGFGDVHRVRLWLPALRGCELGRIAGNGTYVRPVDPATAASGQADKKPVRLLVLGDSVAQGYVAEDPALAWPSLVASRLGADLLNQGVGAQVFQPTALMGLEGIEPPTLVVVALGENYRYGRCGERVVRREVTEFLAMVDRLWPEAGLVVLPPAPAKDSQIVRGSCYAQVPDIVAEAAARLRSQRVAARHAALAMAENPALEGSKLVFDPDGHPTAAGAEELAGVVMAAIEQLECRCLRDFGTFGRCGACVVTAPAPEAEPAAEEPEPAALVLFDLPAEEVAPKPAPKRRRAKKKPAKKRMAKEPAGEPAASAVGPAGNLLVGVPKEEPAGKPKKRQTRRTKKNASKVPIDEPAASAVEPEDQLANGTMRLPQMDSDAE